MPSKTIVDFAYQVRDYMRNAEVVTGKNLLENNLETSTFSGVTATHNTDDSITLTNTATNNQWFGISAAGTINEFNKKLNANVTYVLSSGSNMPSGIALYGRDASENYLFRVESGASYAQYTPSNDIYINIACRVSNGTATGGFTIYPMLCTLEEWEKSHTYEPYYVPVKDRVDELTDALVVEDITNSVTFNNNITWDSGWNHIYKCGKYIWGSLRFKTPSTTSSDYTLLTLPSGCTPIHGKGIVGTMSKSWTGEIAGIISYLSNNNLIIASDAWQTNANVLANIAFFIQ